MTDTQKDPVPVIRIAICTEYPHLLTPHQFLRRKNDWKVQYQVMPLYHPSATDPTELTAYSDRILSNYEWVQNFMGKVCDNIEGARSGDMSTSQLYEVYLMKQLNWASHLGLKTVIIPYKYVEILTEANLVRLLLHHLSRTAYLLTILISIPAVLQNDPEIGKSDENSVDFPSIRVTESFSWDGWHLWRRIQKLSDFHPQIAVNLCFSESAVNYILPVNVQRWISESIRYISLDTSLFMANDAGFPVLPRVWQSIVKTFMAYNVGVILKGEANIIHDADEGIVDRPQDEDDDLALPDGNSLSYYVQYLRFLQGNVDKGLDNVARYSYSFWDALQTPLQPLMDHLESQTYEVFEQDPIKYRQYEDAIHSALKKLYFGSSDSCAMQVSEINDLNCAVSGPPGLSLVSTTSMRESTPASKRCKFDAEDGKSVITVMVVGAGRGPLVSATLSAASRASVPVFIYAVEKNPNAVITLEHRAVSEHWQGTVEIVAQDMRYWTPPVLADLLVSELLGSFGDNELSPECLDMAQLRLLNPVGGLSVPVSYRSFLQPISAPLHWMSARDQQRVSAGGFLENNGVSGAFQRQYGGGRGGASGLEVPYVVYLRRYVPLSANSQAVWDFVHPRPSLWGSSSAGKAINSHNVYQANKRHATVRFQIERDGCCHGFAGYFDCCLFDDVTLSITPETHSDGMFSWFPIFFPLLQPIDVTKGSDIAIDIWR